MITYKAKRENLFIPEIGFYTSTGIAAFEGSTLVRYIADVFLREDRAEKFVRLFNEMSLDIDLLHDVIEDIIAE